jgi:hypothetical protein
MPVPIEYPPLHPDKKPLDFTKSSYWPYFTAEEQALLLGQPIDDAAPEIALLRSEVTTFLKCQSEQPPTDQEQTLQNLYAVAVAARTIGSLVHYQSIYNKTHGKWDEVIKEGTHIFRIRMGIYRQVAALGYAVPDGVLDIEPDLMPHPQSYSDSLKAREQSTHAPAAFSGVATT